MGYGDRMVASFRLGRIAGVKVGLNWSVLIIFGLIAWGLATGRFPAAYPGRPRWAYLAAGLSAALSPTWPGSASVTMP